ncbi:MAG: hypothetical protein AAF497_26090, partial [Planctomycetota bacterium]
MNKRISTERQQEILAEVARLMSERAEQDSKIAEHASERTQRCNEWFTTEHDRMKSVYEAEAKELDVAYVNGLQTARHSYEMGLDKARQDSIGSREQLEAKIVDSRETAELSWKQTRALTIENYQNDLQAAEELGEQTRSTVGGYEEQMDWLRLQAQQMLRRRGLKVEDPPPSSLRVGTTNELVKRYSEAARVAHECLQEVAAWKTTRFLDERWPMLIAFGIFCASVFPFGSTMGWQSWHWLAASVGLAAVVSIVSRYTVHFWVRSKSRETLTRMQAAVVDAQDSVNRATTTMEREHEQRLTRLERRRKLQLEQADSTYEKISQDIEAEHNEKVGTLDHKLLATEKQLESRWEEEAKPFRDLYPPKIESRKQQYESDLQALTDRKEEELSEIESERSSAWKEMAERYTLGMKDALQEVGGMRSHCDDVSPTFSEVDWDAWKPPVADVPAIRFGEYFVDLEQFDGGLPGDERLAIESTKWSVPAVVAFPESPSLLVKAADEGRDQAVRVLRNVMLRMLTTLPSGKVRFTIIDPTGLGQNFSEFMHLADYDERL